MWGKSSKPFIARMPIDSTSLWVSSKIDGIVSSSILPQEEIKELISEKIQVLPPLPDTIFKLEELRNSEDSDPDELLEIIDKDPMIVANILKVANSAMYWFRAQIKNVKMALNLLWFNMISSIAISTAMNTILKPDLKPYDIDLDTFTNVSSTQSRIIDKWKEPKIRPIKNDLQLAAFLQEVWKIVVSMVLIEKWLSGDFKKKLSESEYISDAEENIIYQTSAQITAILFKYWNLNQNIINLIEYSDKPDNAPEELRIWAYALKIVKTISPASNESFTEYSLNKANEIALKAWFDINLLESAISSVRK